MPLSRAFFIAGASTSGSLGDTAMASTFLRVQVSIMAAAFSGEPSVGPS